MGGEGSLIVKPVQNHPGLVCLHFLLGACDWVGLLLAAAHTAGVVLDQVISPTGLQSTRPAQTFLAAMATWGGHIPLTCFSALARVIW